MSIHAFQGFERDFRHLEDVKIDSYFAFFYLFGSCFTKLALTLKLIDRNLLGP